MDGYPSLLWNNMYFLHYICKRALVGVHLCLHMDMFGYKTVVGINNRDVLLLLKLVMGNTWWY